MSKVILAQEYKGFGGNSGVSNLATAATALRIAAKDLGISLSDEQMRMLLGHAAFESGFGMSGAKNSLCNTNNWGAIQATKAFANAHSGQSGYGAVAHQDSDPVGGKFIGWYAVNPTAVAGAKQFLNQVKNQLKSSSNVYDYAARLYQSGYYGGGNAGASGDPRPVGHRSLPFLPAEQKNVNDYTRNIKASMPSSLPLDTSGSISSAQAQKVGPFAPVNDRLTAAGRLKGSPPPTDAQAEKAWEKSKSNAGAYGVHPISSFDELTRNNGFVSFDGKQHQDPEIIAPHTGNDMLDKMLAIIEKALSSIASNENVISITILADDKSTKLEYARVLSLALQEELNIRAHTYTNENDIQIRYEQNKISPFEVRILASTISELFNQATNNTVSTTIKKSADENYQQLDIRSAELHHRKFRIKLYGKKSV